MKKKKPTHSVFSNFAWSLKMLLKYSKAAFFITALFIPINIGLRYLEIYLPSLTSLDKGTQTFVVCDG